MTLEALIEVEATIAVDTGQVNVTQATSVAEALIARKAKFQVEAGPVNVTPRMTVNVIEAPIEVEAKFAVEVGQVKVTPATTVNEAIIAVKEPFAVEAGQEAGQENVHTTKSISAT